MKITQAERDAVYKTIFNRRDVRSEFKSDTIPEHIVPVAYLCLGYVSTFYEKPELEKKGWLKRKSLETLIHEEQWQAK